MRLWGIFMCPKHEVIMVGRDIGRRWWRQDDVGSFLWNTMYVLCCVLSPVTGRSWWRRQDRRSTWTPKPSPCRTSSRWSFTVFRTESARSSTAPSKNSPSKRFRFFDLVREKSYRCSGTAPSKAESTEGSMVLSSTHTGTLKCDIRCCPQNSESGIFFPNIFFP